MKYDMGFDEFIYIVRVFENGVPHDYEFGNLQHALELYLSEGNAQLLGYSREEEEKLIEGD